MGSMGGNYHDNVVVEGPAGLELHRRRRPGAPSMDLRAWPERVVLAALEHTSVPAPRLLRVDGEGLVLTYLPGVDVAALGGATPEVAGQLGALLARVWATPAEGLVAQLGPGRPTRSGGFLAMLAGHAADLAASHPAVADLLAHLGLPADPWEALAAPVVSDRELVLCHGDAHGGNLIVADDGTLALIDWELAVWGDPAWDLAVAIGRGGLDATCAERLVAAASEAYPPAQQQPFGGDVGTYLRVEAAKSVAVDAVRFPQRCAVEPGLVEELAVDLAGKVAALAGLCGCAAPELGSVADWLEAWASRARR